MTGPFGTTAGKWRVADETMGRKLILFDGDKFDRFGDGTPVLTVGLPQQAANARAIAQVPAMLALVEAVASETSLSAWLDHVAAARKIAAELEDKL